MRAFIIVGFLLVAGCAADVSQLGYNYGQGINGGSTTYQVPAGGSYNPGGVSSFVSGGQNGASTLVGTGSNFVSTSGSGSGTFGSGFSSGNRLPSSGNTGSFGSSGFSGAGSLVGTGSNFASTGSNFANSGKVELSLNALDSIPQTVEYSKQFFEFSAPEEQQEEGQIQQQLSNVLKKNLQVVFIKAPENNAATNAALQLAKQAIEQKTAIYVLSKENSGAQLVGQLQQIQESVPTTPEVRFIKYRTPQDIAYARQTIQAQYDSVGGTSESFDGGVAPVLNYASPAGPASGSVIGTSFGSTGSGTVGGSINYASGSGSGTKFTSGGSNTFVSGTSNPTASYLPANAFKK